MSEPDPPLQGAEEEAPWTDDRIRWVEDDSYYGEKNRHRGDKEHENSRAEPNADNHDADDGDTPPPPDLFQDPDPTTSFAYRFERPPPRESGSRAASAGEDPSTPRATTTTPPPPAFIDIELRGYKAEADEIWRSTGLTVWKASEHLCEYLVKNAAVLRGDGKRILEVSVRCLST